jgi:RNA polymerase sigma-70 factor (ECF subfamily)
VALAVEFGPYVNLFPAAELVQGGANVSTTTERIDKSSGAVDGIEVLFRETAPSLWRALYAYSGGRSEVADDALAEAFARAIRYESSIRNPAAWLYRTAFRLAARELRAEQTSLDVALTPIPDSEEIVELMEVLNKLSPNQRAVIVLHYQIGLSVREIAQRLGMAAATVKVHLHRGRRRLRDLLGEEEP